MADYKNLTSKLTDIKPTSAAPGTTSFASTQPVVVSWYGTMYKGEASILGSPTNTISPPSWRSSLPVTASTELRPYIDPNSRPFWGERLTEIRFYICRYNILHPWLIT